MPTRSASASRHRGAAYTHSAIVSLRESADLHCTGFCLNRHQAAKRSELLGQDRRRATGKDVVLPELAQVGPVVVAQRRVAVLIDHHHVHGATRAKVVVDPRHDRGVHQCFGFFERHLALVLRLEDCHRRKRAGAHGHVGQAVRRAVRVDRVERRAGAVDAAQHERGAHVPLIAEEHPLEHRTGGDHARLLAGRHAVEFKLRRDQGGRRLGVGRSTRAAAPDVVRNVVDLLAVLIGHCVALGGARVGAEHDAALIDDANDRRASLPSFRDHVPLQREHLVAACVVKAEATEAQGVAQLVTRAEDTSGGDHCFS
mmetsp:Transcript_26829/g.66412  ORF Transcript_26829/g.66412 Transcript_26829/m.66412 type:complete len:313 (+) Transcript_26829:276-1214(+)